ncbi:MAG: hypothetical protein CMP59_10185 [Flavobacteriales bacterium]|nr:hypothetical protein [Flavobacteriales bacterium]|tara:strand:- start:955 stop:1446 length:492 start_codon:yes stop_codon:yes gene_type:complete
MSPLDIVVLVRLCLQEGPIAQMQLADALYLSQSEISKSMRRSRYAGLLFGKENKVIRQALLEFLKYGIRYAFPQRPGAIVRGMPTSHSALPLSKEIQSDEPYVWPSPSGAVRGHSIIPLYPKVVEAAKNDQKLYEALALIDALRVGRARERSIAEIELEKRLC